MEVVSFIEKNKKNIYKINNGTNEYQFKSYIRNAW